MQLRMGKIKRFSHNECGSSLIEYGLLVALIAVVSITLLMQVGLYPKYVVCLLHHEGKDIVGAGLYNTETGACYELPDFPSTCQDIFC